MNPMSLREELSCAHSWRERKRCSHSATGSAIATAEASAAEVRREMSAIFMVVLRGGLVVDLLVCFAL